MDMELSFEMNDEELEKLRKILTDGGVRHYILEISDNEKIDVVEYKEYEKIEKENQELKKQLENCYCNRTDCSARIKDSKQYDSLVQKVENQQKEFIDWLTNESKELIGNAGYHQRICLGILRKYKEIIGDKE